MLSYIHSSFREAFAVWFATSLEHVPLAHWSMIGLGCSFKEQKCVLCH